MTPVKERPVSDSPVSDSPVSGSPVSGSPVSEKKICDTAVLSTISSEPVAAVHMGVVKRLSLIERFRNAQLHDPNLPKQVFRFTYRPIPMKVLSSFTEGSKQFLLFLGDSYPQHIDIEAYHPFYIDLAHTKEPEDAIVETLKKYKFTDVEIIELRKNHKFFFVFYNCYATSNAARFNLIYKNRININDWDRWQGKGIFFCNPFVLPGKPSDFFTLFGPIINADTDMRVFKCFFSHCLPAPHIKTVLQKEIHHDEWHNIPNFLSQEYIEYNQFLSSEEVQAILHQNLSLKCVQYIQSLQASIPGFKELIAIPSFLEALLITLEEAPLKLFYDKWIDNWLALKEKELADSGIQIENFKEVWKDFYKSLAQEMEKDRLTEVFYVPSPFRTSKWDRFFDYKNPVIAQLLKVGPIYKLENRHGFFPTLQSYFAKGEDPTFKTDLVAVYYV